MPETTPHAHLRATVMCMQAEQCLFSVQEMN